MTTPRTPEDDAIRQALARIVRRPAPNALRERVVDAVTLKAPPLSSWRTLVPIATAAALSLVWSAATRHSSLEASEAGFGPDGDLLAELVAEHSQPLPPEVSDTDGVRALERYVGVPVHPSSFEHGRTVHARLVGGRVMTLHTQRAALLQYMVDTGTEERRASIVIYDAHKITIGSTNMVPRTIGTAEVRVGRCRGYSVASTERAGIGYLVTSDLDPDGSAELAALAY